LQDLVDCFNVLDEPARGVPDEVGQLGVPVVVAHDGLSITGDVERGAALPTWVEDLRHAAAARPEIPGELLLRAAVPWRPLGRSRWIAAALESDAGRATFTVENFNKCVRPGEGDQSPPSATGSRLEPALSKVRLQRLEFRIHRVLLAVDARRRHQVEADRVVGCLHQAAEVHVRVRANVSAGDLQHQFRSVGGDDAELIRSPALDAGDGGVGTEGTVRFTAGVANADRDRLEAVQVQAQAVGDGLELVDGALVVIVLDEEDERFVVLAGGHASQMGISDQRDR